MVIQPSDWNARAEHQSAARSSLAKTGDGLSFDGAMQATSRATSKTGSLPTVHRLRIQAPAGELAALVEAGQAWCVMSVGDAQPSARLARPTH
jgi:hypothetical protein